MKIYNTLTRQKEEFKPIEENKVKMYVCGPTVYDSIHIGNARPYIVFDTVRRYFMYKGYEVNYVQNFTDVDDKIINKANIEKTTMQHIANKHINEILEQIKNLNILNASFTPRVTEEITTIIEMIKILIEKDFAYVVNGSVYFNSKKFDQYGKLSKTSLDDLEAGARVEVDSEKINPSDFILWKPNKPNEPKWKSPWGEGRPGWHIECSAMAKKYLGDTIDIHAGGEDLIFPHHENEIAQSEAANGKQFANYWMHNGFINIDNQKMSKSKNNFFTLNDIISKFPYNVIRFFILSAHYRSPINFSEELLKSSEISLLRIKTCIINLKFLIQNNKIQELKTEERLLLKETDEFIHDFEKSMNDDFNTAAAIASIFDYVKFANINLNENSSVELIKFVCNQIIHLCDILGVSLEKSELNEDEDKINELIAKRQVARDNKDWATADKIREELNEMNIILEDTANGVRWSYKDV